MTRATPDSAPMSPPKRLRVHLDDFAEPGFSPEAEQIRDMMAALAADCRLNSDALHAGATVYVVLEVVVEVMGSVRRVSA